MSAPASAALTFTGERFAPEVHGAIWHEHWHRYCVVAPLARGKRVLDAACGEGYGSSLLAREASSVVGVDVSAEAVAHARARYAADNLLYAQGSCAALPFDDASFDLVVSFETIEHLLEQTAMLAELRRVLVPDGVLVISSPNAPVYSPDEAAHNEFHVRELTRDELRELLAPGFPRQRWYGQRVLAHSALWVEADVAAASYVALTRTGIERRTEPAPPMYFIVVCAADGIALPELPPLSLFDDGAQSLYDDYIRALRREKELFWEERDARNIAEARLTELIAAVNGLAAERQRSSELQQRVSTLEANASRGEALAGEHESRLAASAEALAECQRRLAWRESLAGWVRWPLAALRQRLMGRR